MLTKLVVGLLIISAFVSDIPVSLAETKDKTEQEILKITGVRESDNSCNCARHCVFSIENDNAGLRLSEVKCQTSISFKSIEAEASHSDYRNEILRYATNISPPLPV